MFEEFAPLLVLLLFSLLFSRFTKAIGKANARRAPQKPKAQAPQPAEGAAPAAEGELLSQRQEPRTLAPTVSYERDDSLYQGSLNAVTGEGEDPCHDDESLFRGSPYSGSLHAETGEGEDPCHEDQLRAMPSAGSELAEPAPEVAGLSLSWTGSEIVKGIVISEVLKRRHAG